MYVCVYMCMYVCMYLCDMLLGCCMVWSMCVYKCMIYVCMNTDDQQEIKFMRAGTFTGFFLNLGLVVGATLGLYIDSFMLGKP